MGVPVGTPFKVHEPNRWRKRDEKQIEEMPRATLEADGFEDDGRAQESDKLIRARILEY
jgi:hypothetical protein